jgi:nucleoside 2-deoxyribosyltransferase
MKIALLPVGWETDATPDLKACGQAVINQQLVDNCDILIGIFWARIGTPTTEADSGTVEEIERAANAGKRCIVYFSGKPIPSSANQQQYSDLQAYKERLNKRGLTASYIDTSDFGEKIYRHITTAVQYIVSEERDRKAAEREATVTEKAIELDTQVYQVTNHQKINLATLADAKQTIQNLVDNRFGIQELEDIKDREISEIQNKLSSPELSILFNQAPKAENVPAIVQVIESISSPAMLAISSIGRYGDENSIGWVEVVGDWVEELSMRKIKDNDYVWAVNIKSYPGLLAFYSIGISALRSGRINFFKDVCERKIQSRERNEKLLLLDVLDPREVFSDGIDKFIEPGFDRNYNPVSDHLGGFIKSKLYPDLMEEKYLNWFDLFEFLVVLKSIQLEKQSPCFGSFVWRRTTRPFMIKSIQSSVLKKDRLGMSILGLFDGIETFEMVAQKYDDCVRNITLNYGRIGPPSNISKVIQLAKQCLDN